MMSGSFLDVLSCSCHSSLFMISSLSFMCRGRLLSVSLLSPRLMFTELCLFSPVWSLCLVWNFVSTFLVIVYSLHFSPSRSDCFFFLLVSQKRV